MNDIIIRGGRIVDGTGAEARYGDVAIKDGKITEVGKVSGNAKRTINSEGALVTPGFIDIHTHFDGQFLWDDQLDPCFSSGVTTAIAGNCGVGFAPVRKEHREMLVELMEGVEDIPASVLNAGLDWRWESFSDFMNCLDSRQYSMDIGTHVPHAPVRVYAMGERAVSHETATADELEQMARLVAEGMRAGAVGFSAGRERAHKSTTGDIAPGTFANDQELQALAVAMSRAGKGVFQIVPHGAGGGAMAPATRTERLEEHDRLVKIADAGKCAVTYALLQVDIDPMDWKIMLEATERANAQGRRIYALTLPRSAGILLTLEGYHPYMLRPSYVEIAHLPLPQRAAAMRVAARRAAILSEKSSKDVVSDAGTTAALINALDKVLPSMFLMSAPLDYEPGPQKSLSMLTSLAGKTLEEQLYDHLVAGDGRNFGSAFAVNYENGNLESTRQMLANPWVMSSMSDAGAHVKYVCDGAVTTFQLAFWCRDRVRGPLLPLELMVRKATLDGASLYGLSDRGVIAPGKRADLNIIDFDRLNVEMPYMAYDLPSGGGRLLQKSRGYLATLVAGTVTRQDDEDTGARPGRLIRSSPSP